MTDASVSAASATEIFADSSYSSVCSETSEQESQETTEKTVYESSIETDERILEMKNGFFTVVGSEKNINLDKLNNLVADYDSSLAISVYMPELDTGFYYNENKTFFGASLIKLPFLYYLCTEIDKGNISIDDTLEYTQDSYIGGTGSLQYEKTGTFWTVGELIDKVLYNSDNIAYKMLYNYLDWETFVRTVENDGFTCSNDEKNLFGVVSASELQYYWLRFYENSGKGGVWDRVIDDAVSSKFSPVRIALYSHNRIYDVANKNGWAGSSYHDSAIVYGKTPYIVVILTGSEGESEDEKFMFNLVLEIDNVVSDFCK